ncbi:unnamed protein product, partial [Amoebophrya sp. A120]|eukprot:GSA120T00005308001.1
MSKPNSGKQDPLSYRSSQSRNKDNPSSSEKSSQAPSFPATPGLRIVPSGQNYSGSSLPPGDHGSSLPSEANIFLQHVEPLQDRLASGEQREKELQAVVSKDPAGAGEEDALLGGTEQDEDTSFKMPQEYYMDRWSVDLNVGDRMHSMFKDAEAAKREEILAETGQELSLAELAEDTDFLFPPSKVGMGKMFFFVSGAKERWRYIGGAMIALVALAPSGLSFVIVQIQLDNVDETFARQDIGNANTMAVSRAAANLNKDLQLNQSIWALAWPPLLGLVFLGIWTILMVYTSFYLFESAAVLQIARIRRLYLKAVLTQDFA